MQFGENDQLFGFDRTPFLVAVEPADEGGIDLFFRGEHGATEVRREKFSPYFWSSDALGDARELAGSQPLKFLSRFSSWTECQNARAALQKEGAAVFWFNDPVQQYLTVTGRTLFKEMRFEDMRRLQLAVDSEGGRIIRLLAGDQSGWSEAREIGESVEEERMALEWLTSLIQERDPDVIEGHNLFRDILPAIIGRARKLKVRLDWGRGGEPVKSRSSRLQIAEKTIQYLRCAVRGRHLVDTWLLAQYYDISSRELESFELKTVACHFGVAVEAPDALVQETRSLAGIFCRSYFIQAQIFPYNYQDVIVRGNATKIDALFLREYLRKGYSLPDFPEARPFEGGYTAIFQTGVIKDVWHCDATSLYPSVMLAFDFLPRADELGIFGGLLRELRTFRIQAKQAVRNASDPAERSRLDALQTTFKILINSFYGYLGFAQGHFADFDAAEQVTARGREILRQMVEWLGAQGCEVIEIDTDGIYFRPGASQDAGALQAGLQAALPDGIDVEFDERYQAMFSYKAKNYALLHLDGRMTVKGAALKSRGMEPYLRDYLERFVRLLLEGHLVDAAALRDSLAADLRQRRLPVAELARTEALQDSLASYQKKIGASSRNRSAAFELAIQSGRDYQAGDQISYYITGTKKKVTAYENARLLSQWDPAAPDENIEYYIGKLDDLAKKFAGFTSGVGELPLL